MVVCDGLKGLPDAIETVWPRTIVQTCVVHLLRNASATRPARTGTRSPRRSSRSTPPRPKTAADGAVRWSSPRPGAEVPGDRAAVGERLGRVRAVPALRPRDPHASSARPTPSSRVNARIRRAVRARGHFPNEQAALKCVYLAVMSLDPTGKGRKRWINRWKAALNAFEITFEGRLTPANN